MTCDIDLDDVDPHDIVESLHTVIADVDSFLSDWSQRFGQHITTDPTPATPDEHLRRRIEEFRQEQSRWEAKRELERLRIQEQADQLTEAWLRLEAEQRNLLQLKETRQHGGSGGNGQRDCSEAAPAASLSDANPPVHPSNQTPAISKSRQAAQQQFQRLRREIESSRSNSGSL